ncbi:MAG: hypothetical protein IPK82_24090 [Polyangiaceae bacterium]|nr:hypothetical protein [Polyangiaceae bacterium]
MPTDPKVDDSSGGEGGAPTTNTNNGGEAGSAPAVCDGTCVLPAPIGFFGPTLIATGTPESVSTCPAWTSGVGFQGFADLSIAPHTCPTCTCGPAACVLPETMHASAAKCANAESAITTPFDAAPGWEGTCTQDNAIAANLNCNGAPCVQSLTIAAPTIEPCKAEEKGAATLPQATWGTVARECLIAPLGGEGCATWGQICAPEPPAGFALCVYREGEDPAFACPMDYPHRRVVFAGTADGRDCSPCECGDPSGAECAAIVSAFTDGACGSFLGGITLTTEIETGCFDIPPGSPLGSKEAYLSLDNPGTCAPSGGVPFGEVTPAGPVTLCCQTEDLPR